MKWKMRAMARRALKGIVKIPLMRRLWTSFCQEIIATSAMGVREELDIVSISKQYGAEHVFEKPFRAMEILDAVKEMLSE